MPDRGHEVRFDQWARLLMFWPPRLSSLAVDAVVRFWASVCEVYIASAGLLVFVLPFLLAFARNVFVSA